MNQSENTEYTEKDRPGLPAFGQLSVINSIFWACFFLVIDFWAHKRKNQKDHTGELQNMVNVKAIQLSIISQGTYEATEF